MVVADNFYLYAKHAYYYEGVEASVDIINQHFNQKNNQPAIKLVGDRLKNRSFKDRFGSFGFELALSRLLNPPSLTLLSLGGKLETDYATFFIEIWEAIPSWQTFSFLRFPEAKISEDTQDRILNHLYEAVHEGWISFNGIFDEEAFDLVSPDYCGRMYLDIVEVMNEYHNRLGLALTDLFLTVASEVEDKSPFIPPLDFWNYQLAHNPRKIVHMLINTLFKRYSCVDSTINTYVKVLSEATYFVDASIKAIQMLIDTLSVDELNYYPKYAGYAQVDDAKSWLLQLIELIKNERDISILPGSRLVNNLPSSNSLHLEE